MSDFDLLFHEGDEDGDAAARAARGLMRQEFQCQPSPLSFVVILIWYSLASAFQRLWPPRASNDAPKEVARTRRAGATGQET